MCVCVCVCVCVHLSGLQFPDGGVTGPLQSSESTLQLSALPLRDGGVIYSLTDTAQGQTAHESLNRYTSSQWLQCIMGSVRTSERTPTSLARRWAESRLEGVEPVSLADRESTS